MGFSFELRSGSPRTATPHSAPAITQHTAKTHSAYIKTLLPKLKLLHDLLQSHNRANIDLSSLSRTIKVHPDG